MRGYRAARQSAWSKLGFRHPWATLLGLPVALAVAVWLVVSYVWDTVPHIWLAAAAATVAVALMVKVTLRRPVSWLATAWLLGAVVAFAWFAFVVSMKEVNTHGW